MSCLIWKKQAFAHFMSCISLTDSGILCSKGDQMDQSKIGSFIKDLRKEKNLTQEELAEHFNVARRTVSRWETGANMPDLDILVEMADYFDVDLRELFDGERKSERMDRELEDTVIKAAEYSNAEKTKMANVTLIYFIAGIIALIANQALNFLELPETFWSGFGIGATAGFALAAMVMGVLYVTGKLSKIQEAKKRLLFR